MSATSCWARFFPTHDFWQHVDRSVVKIRRFHCNVAQAGHFEHVHVSFIMGDIEAALVDLGASGFLPIIFDPKFLERATPDALAVMTGCAASLQERSQPTLFGA